MVLEDRCYIVIKELDRKAKQWLHAGQHCVVCSVSLDMERVSVRNVASGMGQG
jgi:hypothetical protein